MPPPPSAFLPDRSDARGDDRVVQRLLALVAAAQPLPRRRQQRPNAAAEFARKGLLQRLHSDGA